MNGSLGILLLLGAWLTRTSIVFMVLSIINLLLMMMGFNMSNTVGATKAEDGSDDMLITANERLPALHNQLLHNSAGKVGKGAEERKKRDRRIKVVTLNAYLWPFGITQSLAKDDMWGRFRALVVLFQQVIN